MVYSGCVSGVDFGLAAVLVDTALTRDESENRKQLRINYLRFLGVPRTGTQPCNYKKIKESIYL